MRPDLRFSDYKGSKCWQAHISDLNRSQDLLDSGLSESEVSSLRTRDFVFEYVPKDDKIRCGEVRDFIKRHEWLGRLSQRSTHRFTARLKKNGKLAGTIIMATPNAFSNLLGVENRGLEKLISRGACISWAPKNLASWLIMKSIKWMVKHTEFRFFTAYSDPEARELGTIYQACNFIYLGQTSGANLQYLDPKTPARGWFSDREFRKKGKYKKYAEEIGLDQDVWQSYMKKYTPDWLRMPPEIRTAIKAREKAYRDRCISRKIPAKHKYVYILGSTKAETKALMFCFSENSPKKQGLPYPKVRGIMKKWNNSSASQIKAFLRCQSRWHWNKIMGLETPTSKAMELGTEKHAELEEYEKTGDPSGLSSITRPIVETGWLGDLPLEESQIERRLDLKTPFVPIVGYIDLEDQAERMITDHKTLSAWKYQKQEAELRNDPQAIVYLKDALNRWGGTEPIRFRHIYYMTKGRPGVRQTIVELEPEEIEKKFQQILQVMEEMHTLSTANPADVPINEGACGDYGGCPFRADCQGCGKLGAFSGLYSNQDKNENKNKEKTMSSYFEILKARKAAQQAETSAPPAETQSEVVVPFGAEVSPKKGTVKTSTINPPDGTPVDEIPAPPAETPAPPAETEVTQRKSRGALKYNGELVSTMSKADLSAVWKELAKSNSGELEWDGESKATRKTIQNDVIAMLTGGVAESPQPDSTPKKASSYWDEQSKAMSRQVGPGRITSVEVDSDGNPVEEEPKTPEATNEVVLDSPLEVALLMNQQMKATIAEYEKELDSCHKRIAAVTKAHDAKAAEIEAMMLEGPRDGDQEKLDSHLFDQVEQLEKELEEAKKKMDGFDQSRCTLYIGCHPMSRTCMYIDEIIEPIQSQVAEHAQLPHYNLLEYGEGPKRVASVLRAQLMNGNLALPLELVCEKFGPCADAVLEVLIPFYRKTGGLIVRRLG